MCRGKIFAVLELELLLAALLRRAGGDETLRSRVAKDRRAKLLVHQDARPLLRTPLATAAEAVVDHLLGRGDFCGLVPIERRSPSEHLALERGAVIEGQDVERSIVAPWHHALAPLLTTPTGA